MEQKKSVRRLCSWLIGLLFRLLSGLLCGLAPLAAAGVPAEYEIVDPGAGSTVEAVIAELKGGAARQNCPPDAHRLRP